MGPFQKSGPFFGPLSIVVGRRKSLKILVTGANGFIGSNLVRTLLGRGGNVRAFIKPGTPETCLDGFDIEKIYGDICDVASLERAITGCTEVYHLAAYNRLWARNPSVFTHVNFEGTENVLRVAHLKNVRRVVYTSTCDFIGMKERRMAREGTEENFPSHEAELPGPYAVSKWRAERAALAHAATGLDCVIVNPTVPIGSYDTTPTEPGRLISDFLRGNLNCFVNRRMNLVDVKDCAEGHVLAMEKGRSGERYILGGQNMELGEFFAKLEQVAGVRRQRIKLPYVLGYGGTWIMEIWSGLTGKEPRVSLEGVRLIRHSFAFSSRKAEQELGYRPADISDALRRAVEWHRQTDPGGQRGFC
jgi:dihydroflavonol-4-reductase